MADSRYIGWARYFGPEEADRRWVKITKPLLNATDCYVVMASKRYYNRAEERSIPDWIRSCCRRI